MSRADCLSKVALFRPLTRQLAFRRCNSLFSAVSSFDSLADRGGTDAMSGASVGAVFVIHTRNCNRLKIPLILGRLLKRCCPSAISRFVIPFGVYPVNRVIQRRALAHIGKEHREGIVPSLTNYYSNRPILREIFKSSVLTSTLHAHPNTVCWATFSANFVAVLQSAIWICHGHLNSMVPLNIKPKLSKLKGWMP